MTEEEKENPYAEILHTEYRKSGRHPQMSPAERAAQFTPFAPVREHGEVLRETERLTEEERFLSEEEEERISAALRFVAENIRNRPLVRVTWFVADSKKRGGAFRSLSSRVEKTNFPEGYLLLETGEKIPVARICALDAEEAEDIL